MKTLSHLVLVLGAMACVAEQGQFNTKQGEQSLDEVSLGTSSAACVSQDAPRSPFTVTHADDDVSAQTRVVLSARSVQSPQSVDEHVCASHALNLTRGRTVGHAASTFHTSQEYKYNPQFGVTRPAKELLGEESAYWLVYTTEKALTAAFSHTYARPEEGPAAEKTIGSALSSGIMPLGDFVESTDEDADPARFGEGYVRLATPIVEVSCVLAGGTEVKVYRRLLFIGDGRLPLVMLQKYQRETRKNPVFVFERAQALSCATRDPQ